jgi:hypothetical protein
MIQPLRHLSQCTLFSLLLLLARADCSAQLQTTDSSVAFAGFWAKGDSAHFELSKIKEKFTNDKLVSKVQISFPVDVFVVDSTSAGYQFFWKFSDLNINGTKIPDFYNTKFNDSSIALSYDYSTNPNGVFLELGNWEEVLRYNVQMIRLEYDKLGRNDVDSILEKTIKMFSSRGSVENILAKDIQLMHAGYGLEFTLNKTIKSEASLPNVFGGGSIPSIIELELIEINEKQQFAVLRMKQFIDEQKLSQFIQQLTDKIKPDNSAEIQIPAMQFSEVNEFHIDLTTGWMKKILSTRTVNTNGVRQVETQVFTKAD